LKLGIGARRGTEVAQYFGGGSGHTVYY